MENQIKYPNHAQVQAVRLVEAALSVEALPDVFSDEAVECAADYLELQVADCDTSSTAAVLKAIIKYYRNCAGTSCS